MNNKDKYSDVLNRYRVFPRLFALIFLVLLWTVSSWFMGLPSPGVEQAGFASTMVATAAAMFRFYVNSGPNSNKNITGNE